MMYKLYPNSVSRLSDMMSIPIDKGNTDYVAYLSWVAEGNAPEIAAVESDLTDAQSKIDALEASVYLNRGQRELSMRLIETEAAKLVTATKTLATILAAQPYYVKLKAMDDEIKLLRDQLP